MRTGRREASFAGFVRGIGVEPLGALVEVDPARGPVSRVAEPALDVHPPRLAGLRVGAHQQYRLLRPHPVGDVGRFADEVKRPVVLPGEPAIAGLALDEDEPVGDLAGDRVAQLDLPVDPGVGLPLVPDEPHLVDLLVDQRDPAVTSLRADVDLLQRAPPSSSCEGNRARDVQRCGHDQGHPCSLATLVGLCRPGRRLLGYPKTPVSSRGQRNGRGRVRRRCGSVQVSRDSVPTVPTLSSAAHRRLHSGGRPTRRFAGCGTRRPPTHEVSLALAVCSSFSD